MGKLRDKRDCVSKKTGGYLSTYERVLYIGIVTWGSDTHVKVIVSDL